MQHCGEICFQTFPWEDWGAHVANVEDRKCCCRQFATSKLRGEPCRTSVGPPTAPAPAIRQLHQPNVHGHDDNRLQLDPSICLPGGLPRAVFRIIAERSIIADTVVLSALTRFSDGRMSTHEVGADMPRTWRDLRFCPVVDF